MVRKTLWKKGFNRWVAGQKSFLTATHETNWYNWILENAGWRVEEWQHVIWTDKATFNGGGAHSRIWVMRSPGKAFNEYCLVPKFKKLSLLIVRGAISDVGG